MHLVTIIREEGTRKERDSLVYKVHIIGPLQKTLSVQ